MATPLPVPTLLSEAVTAPRQHPRAVETPAARSRWAL